MSLPFTVTTTAVTTLETELPPTWLLSCHEGPTLSYLVNITHQTSLEQIQLDFHPQTFKQFGSHPFKNIEKCQDD